MATVKPKTEVLMKLTATGQTHARSQVRVRDVFSVVDEPLERHGTNLGLTPTETLMSSLIGCTNVISKRIAHGMGVTMEKMEIALSAKFDRRGTMLMEEVETPFSDIVLDISVETDATEEQLARIQTDLAMYCPIAKVIRNSGVTITENWTVLPVPDAA
ncbi:MAG: OsmC family protein [Pseudomonadota bacterium]